MRQFRIVICVRFRQSLYVVPWASDGLSTARWVGKSQLSWVPIGQAPLCGSTAKPSEEGLGEGSRVAGPSESADTF